MGDDFDVVVAMMKSQGSSQIGQPAVYLILPGPNGEGLILSGGAAGSQSRSKRTWSDFGCSPFPLDGESFAKPVMCCYRDVGAKTTRKVLQRIGGKT